MKRKKKRYPIYTEGVYRSGWGDAGKPSLPYTIKDLHQAFRDGLIIKELVFSSCNSCKKPFAIRARFSQKELFCPHCGGKNTTYIEDRGKFLFRLVSELIGYLKVDLLKRVAEDDDSGDDKLEF